MKPIIQLLIPFAIIIALIPFFLILVNKNPHVSFNDSPFKYEVSGCDGAPGARAIEENQINFHIKDETIIIKHNLDYTCCANISLQKQVSENVITIIEENKGEQCRCMCTYNINASIDLSRGEYTVKLYGVKFRDEDPNLLKEEKVTIK